MDALDPTPDDLLPAPLAQFSARDQIAMAEALDLAAQAIGLTEPNPRVGCVLTAPDGQVIGRGHTREAGGPHAEVVALREARAADHDLRGATAHVTLEPCSHHGRTPPCADALVEACLARVVIAALDPNPLVAGRGVRRLRSAGIEVVHGLMAEASRELNIGFFSRMLRGRPWVRMKVAGSLDGRSALPDGRSQWITGAAARADGHAWRRRAGAILTGVGTVLDDDPRLDTRLATDPWGRLPLRVVLDSTLRTPPTARLLDAPGRALLLCTPATLEDEARVAALRREGVEIEAVAPGADGRPDLAAVLALLARRGINELHVEAGARLNGALLAAGLVDELLAYVAPVLLGEGRGLAAFGPPAALDQAWRLALHDVARVGEDVRLIGRPSGASAP